MSVLDDFAAFRKTAFGVLVSKAYPTLAVETKVLFTVSDLCIVTSMFAVVTTAITTAATTVKLQANPTLATGTTYDIASVSADIGTTDTPIGDILGVTAAGAVALAQITNVQKAIAVAAGAIEQVTVAGVTGGVTWYLTYVPVAAGATIVAA